MVQQVWLSDLVEDLDLYPRSKVSSRNVFCMCDAIKAGCTLPPMLVDKKTMRIVDGVHRYRTYVQLYGISHKVDVMLKDYKSEQDMFLDAMRLNSTHGYKLTVDDQIRSIKLAEKLSIQSTMIASALAITSDTFGVLCVDKAGSCGSVQVAVSLNRDEDKDRVSSTGHALKWSREVDAQLFYVNRIIALIESGSLDRDNELLMEALGRLRELLESFELRSVPVG